MTATTADDRPLRRFDLEQDRRNRKIFIALASGFALFAIVAGLVVALLIVLSGPKEPPIPGPKGSKNRGGAVITDITPIEPDEIAVEEPPPPPTPEPIRPSERNIDRGLARLDKYFTRCAREHGGLQCTVIRVDFSVGADGRPTQSASRNPYARTPLGRCVADVIKTHGRFASSLDGLADIRREIELHPEPERSTSDPCP